MLMISRPEKEVMSLLREPPAPTISSEPQGKVDDDQPIPKIQLTKACNFFSILPCEVIRMIFNYLTFTDSLHCLSTCPQWYNFIVDDIMERVPLDRSLIHKSTWSKWPALSIGGPISRDYYEVILGLLDSSFHSQLSSLEAIEFRSLWFSRLDFPRLLKALKLQTRMSMICLYHVEITGEQLQDVINTCPNLSQLVIHSSYIRSSDRSEKKYITSSLTPFKNNHKPSTIARCITPSKFSLYPRRSTTTTTSNDNSQPRMITYNILFPKLTYLELSGCTIIDQTVNVLIESIIRCSCNLEHLVVEGCDGPISLVSIFDAAVKSSKTLKTFKAEFLSPTDCKSNRYPYR